jgi:hypothetical protein
MVSVSTLSDREIRAAIKQLADIYWGRRTDTLEKDQLYGLAAKFPQIHYGALRINKRRLKRR